MKQKRLFLDKKSKEPKEFNICCRTQNLFYMSKNAEYLGFGQIMNSNNKQYYHFYKIKERL